MRDATLAKRIKTLALALVLALGMVALVACGAQKGGAEAEIQEVLTSTLEEVRDPSDDTISTYLDEDTIDSLDAYGIDAKEFWACLFSNLDYEIGDIKVDGDTATAELTIENTDLDAAFEVWEEDISSWITSSEAQDLYADEGEAGLMKYSFEQLMDTIEHGDIDVVSDDITVSLEKVDGEWAISEDSYDDLVNALFAGSELI